MLRCLIAVVLVVCVYSSSFAQGKLIFAIDIVRHGDRTPLIASPGMEKIWPQGLGQLTPSGMRQEYELGRILRQRYVKQYQLLPRKYDINSMHVRSSGLPRTLMSAQSLLYGLYPLGTGPSLNGPKGALPKRFQPIPIQTVPVEQDSLLIPNHDKKEYQKLLETYILHSSDWMQKDTELKPHYAAWSKSLDVPINNLFDLIHASDRLYIERLYHLPLPMGLSVQDANSIVEAGKWAILKIMNHPQFAVIIGSELSHTIADEMSLSAQHERPLKYLLFVAHDTTIAAQLKRLGQSIEDIPYAAELNYALFEVGPSHYEVRVSHNQKPLVIEQCGGSSCALDEFVHVMDEQ